MSPPIERPVDERTENPRSNLYSSSSLTNSVIIVFSLVFILRLVAVAATLTTGLNPYAQADIFGFVESAEQIAAGVTRGEYVTVDRSSTYQRWGTFLAPFWLIPGSSLLYASVANAVVGTFAIYNVYAIARYYHSHYAGVVVIAPLAMFPSVLFVHSTPIREAVVLFGITLAARALLVPESRSQLTTAAIAGIGIALAAIHRPDNLVIYSVAIGLGMGVYAYRDGWLQRIHLYLGGGAVTVGAILLRARIEETLVSLVQLREIRMRGRTAYLADVLPESLPEVIAFSWTGALYFLFTPFPWMVENVSDLIVAVETSVLFGFALAAPFGIRLFGRRNPAGAVGLAVGFLVGVVLYGLGTANVGTAVRHRQMFIWVLLLFGGIAIANRFVLRAGSPPDRCERSSMDSK